MYRKPITFEEAQRQMESRMDRPTFLRYRRILEQWDDVTRARAFFSSRVAEAEILGELHNKCNAIVAGGMSGKQAAELIKRYFVGEGADPLAALGFAPPESAHGIAELASYPRIDLILETNTRMASECGQYQQWQSVSDVYEYGIWRCGYSEVHRPEHLARDGKAYRFDHPIWTQSPPGGEFNCHCYRELATADEVREMGIRPQPLDSPFEPSSLGFDPSRSMAEPPPIPPSVPADIASVANRRMGLD